MKRKITSFVEILNNKAMEKPDKDAYQFLDYKSDILAKMTYGQLNERAKKIAAYLKENTNDELILLLFPSGLEFITAFFGTLYSGITAVPLKLPKTKTSMMNLKRIIAAFNLNTILTTSSVLKNINTIVSETAGKNVISIEDISNNTIENGHITSTIKKRPAYLQFTSGFTGEPKAVMISNENIIFNNENIQKVYHLSEESRSLSWIPHYHNLGLVLGILQPLFSGFIGYLYSQYDFINNPYSWLYAIAKYSITFSGGPNFAYDLCIEKINDHQKKTIDISSWEVAYNYAELVDKNTLDIFYKEFKKCGFKKTALYPCYGLTETTSVIASGEYLPEQKIHTMIKLPNDDTNVNQQKLAVDNKKEFMIRYDNSNSDLLIANPNSFIKCREKEYGEIWVRSKSNAMGYWKQPDKTKEIFNAYLKDTGEGPFLRTGDIGFMEGRSIYIIGRKKNGGDIKEADNNKECVAIIGMEGIFPQSENYEQFWNNLEQGKNLVTEIPSNRWDWKEVLGEPKNEPLTANIKWGAFIPGIEFFDASFFNISPKEAQYMDPMQRKLIQTVWKTVENAGYKMSDISRSKVGVFIGIGTFDYMQLLMESNEISHAYSATGIPHCMASNRISFLFDFTGPSESIDTACSSSLVALNRAVRAVKNKECEIAIVGGVNAILCSKNYIALSNAGMLSEDGKCKTFDQEANGYVRGEGIGTLLIKPLENALEDKDCIHGIIKGVAENHGGRTNSLTAPNPFAQSEVIMDAFKQAGISPDMISYIETHGTGTSLGDPIEINGLKIAFNTLFNRENKKFKGKAYCGLGTVKTNIGHLEAAAGIAGVIKVLLAMKNKKIPAHLHLNTLNKNIDIKNSPFYIIDNKTKPWKKIKDDLGKHVPRIAGVSSFGYGGVNSHVIIEEANFKTETTRAKTFTPNLYILSAKTEERLMEYITHYLYFLENNNTQIEYKNLFYTLQIGREAMDVRLAIISNSPDDLIKKLNRIVAEQKFIPLTYQGSIFMEKIDHDLGRRIFNPNDNDVNELIQQFLREKDFSGLSQLWVLGGNIEWQKLYQNDCCLNRISLPTYPFAKEKHWFSPLSAGTDRMRDSNINNSDDDEIYDSCWIESIEEISYEIKDVDKDVQFILLCDKKGFSNAISKILEKNNIKFYEIYYDDQNKKIGENKYYIDPYLKSDYKKIFKKISENNNNFKNYIINFWPMDFKESSDYSLKDISEATRFTCETTLNLFQSLITIESTSQYNVWFICSNVQPIQNKILNLKIAALWGLSKAIFLEHPDIIKSIIDIGSLDSNEIAKIVLAEVMKDSDENEIVYRNKKRYVPRLIPSKIQDNNCLKIEETGTYLVTGGLGTLGLLAAEWLSKYKAKKVLLLSRHGLNGKSSVNITVRKKEIINKIKDNGTEVEVVEADVTNKEQMEKICNKHMVNGELRGVFHAAGKYTSKLIKDMDYKDFLEVIESKIHGTWILNEILKDYKVDYLVLYSSAASTWGTATAGHYGAANYFLDIYTNFCEINGLPATSVNWGGMWKDSGIVTQENEKHMKSVGIKYTLPAKGMQQLETILKSGERQKVIAPVKWDIFLQVIQARRKYMLFEIIEQKYSRTHSEADYKKQFELFKARIDNLSEKEQNNAINENLSSMLKEILGIQQDNIIPADKGFFELGLDSLSSIDLKNRVKMELGIEISTTIMFDFNTIQLLSEYIQNNYIEVKKSKTTKQMNEEEINDLDQYDKNKLIETLIMEIEGV